MKQKNQNKHQQYLKIIGEIDKVLEEILEFAETGLTKQYTLKSLEKDRTKIFNKLRKTKEFKEENLKIIETYPLKKIEEINEDDIEIAIIKKYYNQGYNRNNQNEEKPFKDDIKEIGKIDSELEELREISFFAAEFSEQTISLEDNYQTKQIQKEKIIKNLEKQKIFSKETIQLLRQAPGYLKNYKSQENEQSNIEIKLIKKYYMQGYEENEEYNKNQKQAVKKITKNYSQKHY